MVAGAQQGANPVAPMLERTRLAMPRTPPAEVGAGSHAAELVSTPRARSAAGGKVSAQPAATPGVWDRPTIDQGQRVASGRAPRWRTGAAVSSLRARHSRPKRPPQRSKTGPPP